MNKPLKESYKLQVPSCIDFFSFRMTSQAMSLLIGTTGNRRDEKISNNTLFYDLRSRMAVCITNDDNWWDRKDEDEIEGASRCVRAATRLGNTPKSGRRR